VSGRSLAKRAGSGFVSQSFFLGWPIGLVVPVPGTKDFCYALASLVGQIQNTLFKFLCPPPSILGRQPCLVPCLLICLWCKPWGIDSQAYPVVYVPEFDVSKIFHNCDKLKSFTIEFKDSLQVWIITNYTREFSFLMRLLTLFLYFVVTYNFCFIVPELKPVLWIRIGFY
jgi:hypothetical protein